MSKHRKIHGKGEFEWKTKMLLAEKGCTFIKLNWKKLTVHFLDPKGNKKVEYFA